MILFGRTISRVTVMVIGVILIIAVIAFGTSQCAKKRAAEKQAEVSKGQAGASIDAGAEATNTLGNIIDKGRETDATVKEGQDAIRKAPESERGVRTVDAACRLRAYVNTERCARLRATGS